MLHVYNDQAAYFTVRILKVKMHIYICGKLFNGISHPNLFMKVK